MRKRALKAQPVIVKAPHRNGDIAPAAARFAHELNRSRRRKLALGAHIGRGAYAYIFNTLGVHGGGVAEHIVGVIDEGGIFAPRLLPAAYLRLDSLFLCKGKERARSYAAQLEYLAAAFKIVAAEAHCQVDAL